MVDVGNNGENYEKETCVHEESRREGQSAPAHAAAAAGLQAIAYHRHQQGTIMNRGRILEVVLTMLGAVLLLIAAAGKSPLPLPHPADARHSRSAAGEQRQDAGRIGTHRERRGEARSTDTIVGLPDGFYVVLRLVVTVGGVYWAWRARKASQRVWMWIFAAIALLFNPFLPMRMQRTQ